jgi:hypothetical protein
VRSAFRSLANPRDTAEILRRLTLVRPDSPRRWGRMTPHQMVCHLRDAFLMGTEQKPVSHLTGVHHRTVVKWIALYVPVAWPSGIRTRPEVDQLIGGTPPSEFPADVAALEALVETLTSRPEFFAGRRHPIFGPLSEAAWLRWGYLHMDHHLRQFGA